jgi:atrial natriuretic peptide receptor A
MLTTVGGTYSQLAKFVARLLHNFNWRIVSFLYHTYSETSGKGKSPCHFTLGEVYMQMGGVKNDNLTYESFDGDEMNVTSFENVLRDVQSKARGKTASSDSQDGFVACVAAYSSLSLCLSVVILCASPPKVREILLAAEGLGLMDRGEYVFFNVELFAR